VVGGVAAGSCSIPVSYPAGTSIAVTEGIVPGTKAETIVGSGADSTVTGSVSIPSRTITVILGTPVTAAPGQILPGNEAVVTYTNEVAAPGELKICKLNPPAGVLAPIGTSFGFTLFRWRHRYRDRSAR
jgi:hypothetical protein